VFGLRAGNEDGGRDVEGQAVEFLLAGDVLDGLVGEAALDCGFVGEFFVRSQCAVGVGVEVGAGYPCNLKQEKQRVARRVGAEIRRRVKLGSGAGEGFAKSRRSCQF
jgi:hypothetical protein